MNYQQAKKKLEMNGQGQLLRFWGRLDAKARKALLSQIAGIEVMDLEDGVQALWKQGIYAESGMGCTGPIIRVSDANLAKAKEILEKEGFIG